MKKFVLACALVLISAAPSFAEDNASLSIDQAYAYATAQSQKNGAVFLSIHNKDGVDDALISAEGNVAERIELHTHITEGDTMKMRKVERFDIAENAEHTLHPMGDHIMLMGLNAPLQKGAVFPLVLNFENAGRKEISVEVVAPGQKHGGDTPSAHDAHEHGAGHDAMEHHGETHMKEKTDGAETKLHDTRLHETEMHDGHHEKENTDH